MQSHSEDPRLGLTSASNAEPDSLCPGRHLAQRGLTGKETRDSLSGTMVHAAFAGTLDTGELSNAQRKTLNRGKIIEEECVQAWFRKLQLPLDDSHAVQARAHRELRLWAYRNGQKIHSGGIDALWLAGDMRYALVEDLKSLFGDIDDAASNQQLRDYAALVHLNYGCEEVSVFINQPNVRWRLEDQKLVTYRGQDLQQAVAEMQQRVLASQSLDSPRIPGIKQCNFCLACGTSKCPESLAAIRDYGRAWDKAWEFWDPGMRGAVIEDTKLVEKLVKKALEVAKEHIAADPKWATGWEMTPEQKVRKIEDAEAAAAILADAFATDQIPRTQILQMVAKLCKITLGDLEALHKQLSSTESEAERAAEFKMLFEHLIQMEVRSGSLRQVK